MVILYSLIFLMIIAALALLAIPFFRNTALYSRSFLLLALFTIVLSLGIYQCSGDKLALRFWFTQGKPHYELLTQFEALGGVEGMIQRVQAKVKDNPNDAQGWLILGKLYTLKHNDKAAKKAYQKAQELKSN